MKRENNTSLFEYFSNYTIDNLFNDNILNCKKFNITIHDHWLTEDECLKNLISFVNVVNGNFNFDYYKTFENKFLASFNKIFELYNVYYVSENLNCKNNTSNYVTFKFNSFKELEIYLVSCLRREIFTIFAVPDIKVIILGQFDLTLSVFSFDVRYDIKNFFINTGLNIII